MILEFKTPRNTCGHRNYIKIDTNTRTFTRQAAFIPEGIEISRREYKNLLEIVAAEYQEQ